jgi:hypothetical protein
LPTIANESDRSFKEKYYQSLHEKLLKDFKVTEEQLVNLAKHRLDKIQEALLKQSPNIQGQLRFEGVKVRPIQSDGVPMEMTFIN